MEVAWRAEVPLRRRHAPGRDVAAAALYALDHHVERLAVDHAAGPPARRRAGMPPACPVELDRVETNFVQIDTSRLDLPRREVLAAAPGGGGRAVAHLRAVSHPRRHAPRSRRRRHRRRPGARPGDAGGVRPRLTRRPRCSEGSLRTDPRATPAPSSRSDGRRRRRTSRRRRRRRRSGSSRGAADELPLQIVAITTASEITSAAISTLRKPRASGSISHESSTTAGIRNIATCADEESAISAASLILPR